LNAVVKALQLSVFLDESSTAAQQGAPAPAHRRGLRVLVVEDNEFNQEVAANLLKKWGHVPTIASDGKAALNAFDVGRFDLILMDVQMSEMDGFAVTRAVCAREQRVHRVAHMLKAVVGSFGAQKAGRATARLEDEANSRTLAGCETAFVTLNEAVATLQQALDEQFKVTA
jgi:CheY-like chemotaxis protein